MDQMKERTTRELSENFHGMKTWVIDGFEAKGTSLYDALTDDVGPRNEPLYSYRIVDNFDYDEEFEYLRGEYPNETGDTIWSMVHDSLNIQLAEMVTDMQRANRRGDWKGLLEAALIEEANVKITTCQCNYASCGADVDVEDGYFCPSCNTAWCEDCRSPIGEECPCCDHVVTVLDAMREALEHHGQI